MKRLKYIKDLIIRYKTRYITGIICLLSVDGLQLVFPKLFEKITDSLKSGNISQDQLFYYGAAIVALSAGVTVLRFLWRYFVLGSSKLMEKALRERFYGHLQKLSVNYFNNHKTGDLMAHATNDIGNISLMIGQGVALAFDSALIPLVSIVMMLRTAGLKLTLATFAPLIVLALLLIFNVRIVHKRLHRVQESFSLLTEKARESFSGIRVVKSFAQEEKIIKNFSHSNEENLIANLGYIKIMSMLFPLIMAISFLAFAITVWYGGILVIDEAITLGQFIAFATYLGMLIWPMAALGWLTSIFQRGVVSLERINIILDEQPEISDIPGAEDVKSLKGGIVVENLSFSYPGSEQIVLKNISFSLEKGKTLALVGKTGSGKTTLVNLILRLYDITEGSIMIDGTPVSRLPLSTLRSNVGYVPQDTFLFSSTVKDNIDFFQGAAMERIIEMSRIAGVYDNIMDFPQQFDTVVGERGVTLSGGQKQRIAIARALNTDPRILILDDSLSAVDTKTEEKILKDLEGFMENRTSIIISHRISTIKNADQILVLDNGSIAEKGTHEELLEMQGIYAELYSKQLLTEHLETEGE